jgi:hypothetical protein
MRRAKPTRQTLLYASALGGWLGVSMFFAYLAPISWWWFFMSFMLGTATFSAFVLTMVGRMADHNLALADEYDRMAAWCAERGYHPEDER